LFYDLVFQVDGSYIKGNSAILRRRSVYFSSMLSDLHRFKEQDLKKLVLIKGIPREFFVQIIQYIYSDQFYISTECSSLDYFLNLLIYADYFLLPRMGQIISRQICSMVTIENVVSILLIASDHNAHQLMEYCIQFICVNEYHVSQ
jgi:hypothetical protein